MPRPEWQEEYWRNLDKDTARKIRSTCPRCGSSETYYNERFKTWRCGRCEHIFVVTGLEPKPWWKRIFPFWK